MLLAPFRLLSQRPITSLAVRSVCSKHFDPKWRPLRRRKVVRLELPDYERLRKGEKMTPEERRSYMREEGLFPPRQYSERPINIASTSDVFEPYIPPEGDGRASIVSKEGLVQFYKSLTKKGTVYKHLKKVKEYEENFDEFQFALDAEKIYNNAHLCLEQRDNKTLREFATELAYPQMLEGMRYRTVRWKFLESLEPARVVHVKTTSMLAESNLYAQITVRIHSKQTLAIYDRFGRLMYGSETVPRDVLEYVVFEKHLSSLYGSWRLHSKIEPEWMPPRQPQLNTFIRKSSPKELAALETAVTTAPAASSSSVAPSASS